MSTIHLIVVGDTNDRLGLFIKGFVKVSVSKMEHIATSLQVPLNKVLVTGDNFTGEGITKAVEDLNPASDDAVVFLSTCHGVHGEKTDPWPYFGVGTRDEMGRPHVYDAAAVYRTLRRKEPRLLMMVTQACNPIVPESMIEDITPKSLDKFEQRESGDRRAIYEAMFLRFSGEILCTSSKPGEVSLAGPRGGPFSWQFFNALNEIADAPLSARQLNTLAMDGQSFWEAMMMGAGAVIDKENLYEQLNRLWWCPKGLAQGCAQVMQQALAESGNKLGHQRPVWQVVSANATRSTGEDLAGLEPFPGGGWRTGSWTQKQIELLESHQGHDLSDLTVDLMWSFLTKGGAIGFAVKGLGTSAASLSPGHSAARSPAPSHATDTAPKFCSSCGNALSVEMQFCSDCGQPIDQPVAPPAAASALDAIHQRSHDRAKAMQERTDERRAKMKERLNRKRGLD